MPVAGGGLAGGWAGVSGLAGGEAGGVPAGASDPPSVSIVAAFVGMPSAVHATKIPAPKTVSKPEKAENDQQTHQIKWCWR